MKAERIKVQSVEIEDTGGEAFLVRLGSLVGLTRPEKEALRLALGPRRHVAAHEDVLAPGSACAGAVVILAGAACRVAAMSNGRRQITSFLLPGDVCDFKFLTHGTIDQGVRALSPVLVAGITHNRLNEIGERYPHIVQALLTASSIEDAITRQWLISLGQRSAVQRLAHLFCELHTRLDVVGLVDRGGFHLPMTQSELGEAMGLSTVHVNRTLQELRRLGLIETREHRVTILDFDRLAACALFDPAYLGVGPRR